VNYLESQIRLEWRVVHSGCCWCRPF